MELELQRAELAALRDRAAASRVTVDVWVALTLELSIAAPTPDDRRRVQRLLPSGQREAFRLPDGALARWQVALVRPRLNTSIDELPEVVIPARLAAMLGRRLTLAVRRELRADDWELARLCEITACSHGGTVADVVAGLLAAGSVPLGHVAQA